MISRAVKRVMKLLNRKSQQEPELIQEYHRVVEQLEKRSELEEIGSLTASIEHEIKNPLAVIESELERMIMRFQHQPAVVAGLERIKEQKERIYAVTKIIPVLRADATFSEKSMVKTNIRSLVHQSIKAVKREINTRHIVFKDNMSSDFFVNAYPPLLQQAIVNIMKNSIEAINESGRERGLINIRVRPDKLSKNLVRIEIIDNGCGIRTEDLSKVTTLFTTKSERKPNAGLGLFITNKIVKTHGGNIGIESKVNEGTSVSIILAKK